MESNGPTLKACISIHIALENLKRDALLPQGLGQSKTTETRSDDEDVHPNGRMFTCANEQSDKPGSKLSREIAEAETRIYNLVPSYAWAVVRTNVPGILYISVYYLEL